MSDDDTRRARHPTLRPSRAGPRRHRPARGTARRLSALTAAAVAMLALAGCTTPPVGADAFPHCGPASVTVVSYNIRYDNPDDGPDRWERRREAVTDYLRQTRADIIGIQEALPRQRAWLAGRLDGYTGYGSGRDDAQGNGEGAPIHYLDSRFDALDRGTFWLSPYPEVPGSRGWDADLPRIATWIRLRDRHSGCELLAVNTHFDHIGAEARLQSSRLLRRRIDELADTGAGRVPVILTGDFNERPGRPAYLAIVSPDDGPAGALVDARHASRQPHEGGDSTVNAFTAIEPGAKIDHIFVRDVAGVRSHRIDDPRIDGRFVSDHLPVVAVVELQHPLP